MSFYNMLLGEKMRSTTCCCFCPKVGILGGIEAKNGIAFLKNHIYNVISGASRKHCGWRGNISLCRNSLRHS